MTVCLISPIVLLNSGYIFFWQGVDKLHAQGIFGSGIKIGMYVVEIFFVFI